MVNVVNIVFLLVLLLIEFDLLLYLLNVPSEPHRLVLDQVQLALPLSQLGLLLVTQMLILVPVLLELHDHGRLPEGVLEQVVGEHLDAQVLHYHPVQ